jgi:hypothetical protein
MCPDDEEFVRTYNSFVELEHSFLLHTWYSCECILLWSGLLKGGRSFLTARSHSLGTTRSPLTSSEAVDAHNNSYRGQVFFFAGSIVQRFKTSSFICIALGAFAVMLPARTPTRSEISFLIHPSHRRQKYCFEPCRLAKQNSVR